MAWDAANTDPWDELEQRSKGWHARLTYPPAELNHLRYHECVTRAARQLGITESAYIRAVFDEHEAVA